jgi:YfiH family protein
MLHPKTSQALADIRHGFFGRDGGVSSGLYTSLNCGLGSRDSREHVLENRDRVARHLGSTGDRLLTCFQIHSATAIVVDRPWAPDSQPKADALVTKTPGIVVGALAADCTPILFADLKAGVVAAAHAGWKGAISGILQSTIEAMVSIGANRGDIVAMVGPCISQTSYEVGNEFESQFVSERADNKRFFSIPDGKSKAHFDLPGYVTHQLVQTGIGYVSNESVCTYPDDSGYFSYRRTTHRREADYGRQISAIVLA